MTPISLRVRELREAKGWSQVELAERADVRRATLSAIENNQTTGVDFETLEKLARAFGVDPALLIVKSSDLGSMSTTVRMLTGHKVTVSESDDTLQWECSCGRRAPDEWCPHMWAVVCRGTTVPLGVTGKLEAANRIIGRHIDIVAVLRDRLMKVTDKHGSNVGEVEQLTAAIARLTSGK